MTIDDAKNKILLLLKARSPATYSAINYRIRDKDLQHAALDALKSEGRITVEEQLVHNQTLHLVHLVKP